MQYYNITSCFVSVWNLESHPDKDIHSG